MLRSAMAATGHALHVTVGTTVRHKRCRCCAPFSVTLHQTHLNVPGRGSCLALNAAVVLCCVVLCCVVLCCVVLCCVVFACVSCKQGGAQVWPETSQGWLSCMMRVAASISAAAAAAVSAAAAAAAAFRLHFLCRQGGAQVWSEHPRCC
jgi:hypothetical protein